MVVPGMSRAGAGDEGVEVPGMRGGGAGGEAAPGSRAVLCEGMPVKAGSEKSRVDSFDARAP